YQRRQARSQTRTLHGFAQCHCSQSPPAGVLPTASRSWEGFQSRSRSRHAQTSLPAQSLVARPSLHPRIMISPLFYPPKNPSFFALARDTVAPFTRDGSGRECAHLREIGLVAEHGGTRQTLAVAKENGPPTLAPMRVAPARKIGRTPDLRHSRCDV